MSTLSEPTAATENPKKSAMAGVGLVNVVSSAPLVLNKYAAPALVAPVSSERQPMRTRSFPTPTKLAPNSSPVAGKGLLKVVSSAPLTLNRYAAPKPVEAPMSTLSEPTAARATPNLPNGAGVGLVYMN